MKFIDMANVYNLSSPCVSSLPAVLSLAAVGEQFSVDKDKAVVIDLDV